MQLTLAMVLIRELSYRASMPDLLFLSLASVPLYFYFRSIRMDKGLIKHNYRSYKSTLHVCQHGRNNLL